jgi:hypothetical protein
MTKQLKTDEGHQLAQIIGTNDSSLQDNRSPLAMMTTLDLEVKPRHSQSVYQIERQ